MTEVSTRPRRRGGPAWPRISAVCLVLVAGCAPSGPDRGDVRPEAYLVFPSAVETGRSWLPEEHARSIDGPDLSHLARMTIRYTLAEPTTNSAVWAWYGERLHDIGWTPRVSNSTNHSAYDRRVGDRKHTFDIEAGRAPGDPITRFSVYYSIGFTGE